MTYWFIKVPAVIHGHWFPALRNSAKLGSLFIGQNSFCIRVGFFLDCCQLLDLVSGESQLILQCSKETMTKKGVEFARECLIFEVCQPQQAKKVLEQNMSVSTALLCRISIYEEGGKTILATVKPAALLAMFRVPQLEPVAQEVEDAIIRIMKEATAG